MTDQEKQDILDEEHLKLLRIGYFVAGAADLFFAFFPLIYVAIGIAIAAAGLPVPTHAGDPSPALIGVFLVVFGLVISFFFGARAVLQMMAARALGQRRSLLLCQIAAGVSCVQMPWGVLLGVFTFLVLGRKSVKQLFEGAPAQLTAAPARAATSLFDDAEANVAERGRSRRL
jgi:hypothetical protein